MAFFFVLSGFIVAYVHSADVGHSDRLPNYIRSRLTRVYPVYWVVLTVVLAMTAIGFNSQTAMTPSIVFGSFALVGDDAHRTVLAVAWTLYHEMAFYAVFAVAIVSRPAGVALAAMWVAGIVAAALGFRFLPIYLSNPINLLFPLGIATWWLSTRRGHYFPIAIAWVGAAAFLAVGMENVFRPTFPAIARILLFGLASALTIAALVAREQRRPIRIPAVLATLGAASYSIYLIHFPLLGILARVHSIAAVRAAPPELVFVLLVAVATALGVAFHRYVEKPLVAVANDLWRRAYDHRRTAITPA